MTDLTQRDLSQLRLFATYPHPCSYLADREATTLFVDPEAEIDQALYSELSSLGFRRSGGHIYRPHCANCQACVPARIPVARFQPHRSQRRVWKRNQDLSVAIEPTIDRDDYYQLYADYIGARHSDGDMYPPSREQYRTFLSSEWGLTRYFVFRRGEQVAAIAVSDRLDHGLSAVYTFFDPALADRSLGTYALLYQIEYAREQGLDSLYLGYWIKESPKMNYKSRFRPLELLINRRWLEVR